MTTRDNSSSSPDLDHPPSVRPSTLRARIARQTRLGKMCRLYRTVRQQSLREVVPQIGISAATLMRIEQGQAFDADTLLKLWAWLLTDGNHEQDDLRQGCTCRCCDHREGSDCACLCHAAGVL